VPVELRAGEDEGLRASVDEVGEAGPFGRPALFADAPEIIGDLRHRRFCADPQLAAALDTLENEPLGRAGDEVRDDGVDGDAPAGDRDPRLPRWDELAADPTPLRLPIELEGEQVGTTPATSITALSPLASASVPERRAIICVTA